MSTKTVKLKVTVLNSSDKSIEICQDETLMVCHIPRQFVLNEVRDPETKLITEITIPRWLAEDRGFV